MTSEKRDNIISIMRYKQALPTKVVAWLVILIFSFQSATYGYERDTNTNLRAIRSIEAGGTEVASAFSASRFIVCPGVDIADRLLARHPAVRFPSGRYLVNPGIVGDQAKEEAAVAAAVTLHQALSLPEPSIPDEDLKPAHTEEDAPSRAGLREPLKKVMGASHKLFRLVTSVLSPLSYIMWNHKNAYKAWTIARLTGRLKKGAVLIHFDYHGDLFGYPYYGYPESVEDALSEKHEYFVNTFIAPAVLDKTVSEVVVVAPKGAPLVLGQTPHKRCGDLSDGTNACYAIEQTGAGGDPICYLVLQDIFDRNTPDNILSKREITVRVVRDVNDLGSYRDDPRDIICDLDFDFIANKYDTRYEMNYNVLGEPRVFENLERSRETIDKEMGMLGEYFKKIGKRPKVVTLALSPGNTPESYIPYIWHGLQRVLPELGVEFTRDDAGELRIEQVTPGNTPATLPAAEGKTPSNPTIRETDLPPGTEPYEGTDGAFYAGGLSADQVVRAEANNLVEALIIDGISKDPEFPELGEIGGARMRRVHRMLVEHICGELGIGDKKNFAVTEERFLRILNRYNSVIRAFIKQHTPKADSTTQALSSKVTETRGKIVTLAVPVLAITALLATNSIFHMIVIIFVVSLYKSFIFKFSDRLTDLKRRAGPETIIYEEEGRIYKTEKFDKLNILEQYSAFVHEGSHALISRTPFLKNINKYPRLKEIIPSIMQSAPIIGLILTFGCNVPHLVATIPVTLSLIAYIAGLLFTWSAIEKPPAEDGNNRHTTGPIEKGFLRFAGLSAADQGVFHVFGIVEMLIVSRFLGFTGAEAVPYIAAVTLAKTVIRLVHVSAYGVVSAIQPLISKSIGANNTEHKKSAANALIAGMLLSAIAAISIIIWAPNILALYGAKGETLKQAVPYLKVFSVASIGMCTVWVLRVILHAAGDMKNSIIISYISVGVTALLCLPLIHGTTLFIYPGITWSFPKLGLPGLAWAHLIGRACGIAWGIKSILFMKAKDEMHRINLEVRHFIPDPRRIARIIKTGSSQSMQMLQEAVYTAIIIRLLTLLGGDFAIAAFGIVCALQAFVYIAAGSLGTATATYVGHNLGADKPERVEKTINIAYTWGKRIAVIFTIVSLIYAPQIIALYKPAPQTAIIAVSFLKIISLSFWAVMFMFIGHRAFIGSEDLVTPAIISFTTLFLMSLPLVYYISLMLGGGIRSVWIIFICVNITRALMLKYFFNKKEWAHSEPTSPETPPAEEAVKERVIREPMVLRPTANTALSGLLASLEVLSDGSPIGKTGETIVSAVSGSKVLFRALLGEMEYANSSGLDADIAIVAGMALKENKELWPVLWDFFGIDIDLDREYQDVDVEYTDKGRDYLQDRKDLKSLLFNQNRDSFLKLCSIMRMLYPYERYRPLGESTPFIYAHREGLLFELGNGLYYCPVTESFRRHLICSTSDEGTIRDIIEIKMPGDVHPNVNENHFLVYNDIADSERTYDVLCMITDRLMCAAIEPSMRTLDLYGRKIRFSQDHPPRVLVYKYVDGRRLEKISPPAMRAIASSLRMTPAQFGERITQEVKECVDTVHNAGWVGYRGSLIDLHLDNLVLIRNREGFTIRLVGDFTQFVKTRNPLKKWKERKRVERSLRSFLQTNLYDSPASRSTASGKRYFTVGFLGLAEMALAAVAAPFGRRKSNVDESQLDADCQTALELVAKRHVPHMDGLRKLCQEVVMIDIRDAHKMAKLGALRSSEKNWEKRCTDNLHKGNVISKLIYRFISQCDRNAQVAEVDIGGEKRTTSRYLLMIALDEENLRVIYRDIGSSDSVDDITGWIEKSVTYDRPRHFATSGFKPMWDDSVSTMGQDDWIDFSMSFESKGEKITLSPERIPGGAAKMNKRKGPSYIRRGLKAVLTIPIDKKKEKAIPKIEVVRLKEPAVLEPAAVQPDKVVGEAAHKAAAEFVDRFIERITATDPDFSDIEDMKPAGKENLRVLLLEHILTKMNIPPLPVEQKGTLMDKVGSNTRFGRIIMKYTPEIKDFIERNRVTILAKPAPPDSDTPGEPAIFSGGLPAEWGGSVNVRAIVNEIITTSPKRLLLVEEAVNVAAEDGVSVANIPPEERKLITAAEVPGVIAKAVLKRVDWNVQKGAVLLGISSATLYRWKGDMPAYDVDDELIELLLDDVIRDKHRSSALVERIEILLSKATLRRVNDDKKRAAKMLGVSQATFYRFLSAGKDVAYAPWMDRFLTSNRMLRHMDKAREAKNEPLKARRLFKANEIPGVIAKAALKKTGGNNLEAISLLGINRSVFHGWKKKMPDYDVYSEVIDLLLRDTIEGKHVAKALVRRLTIILCMIAVERAGGNKAKAAEEIGIALHELVRYLRVGSDIQHEPWMEQLFLVRDPPEKPPQLTVQTRSPASLAAKTREFKAALRRGASLDDILPEAFSVFKLAAKRAIGLTAAPEQIHAAKMIHQGCAIEMKPSEGKTLSIAMAAYLNALTEKGVHIHIFNDFLAKRDGQNMGKVFDLLGITTGVLTPEASYIYSRNRTQERKWPNLKRCSKRRAYECDVTYGEKDEIIFDYLRDNTVKDPSRLAQRDNSPQIVIVDEGDDVLIDEAYDPLILSKGIRLLSNIIYNNVYRFVDNKRSNPAWLQENVDYSLNSRREEVTFTEGGIRKIEEFIRPMSRARLKKLNSAELHNIFVQALRVKHFYERDRDYVVVDKTVTMDRKIAPDNTVVLVDNFTGRLKPTQTWSNHVHQFVEAKEELSPRPYSVPTGITTYQNYYRMMRRDAKLAIASGTIGESAEELRDIYGLNTVEIPLQVESQRYDEQEKVFDRKEDQKARVLQRISEIHRAGNPLLIFVPSIREGINMEALIDSRLGLKCSVLDGRDVKEERDIIGSAGKRGAITIATNAAGRGMHIEVGRRVNSMGTGKKKGLAVIITFLDRTKRGTLQKMERTARRGNPGWTERYYCREDELYMRFGNNDPQGKSEDYYRELRQMSIRYDDVLDRKRRAFYFLRKAVLTDIDTEPNVLHARLDIVDALWNKYLASLEPERYKGRFGVYNRVANREFKNIEAAFMAFKREGDGLDPADIKSFLSELCPVPDLIERLDISKIQKMQEDPGFSRKTCAALIGERLQLVSDAVTSFDTILSILANMGYGENRYARHWDDLRATGRGLISAIAHLGNSPEFSQFYDYYNAVKRYLIYMSLGGMTEVLCADEAYARVLCTVYRVNEEANYLVERVLAPMYRSGQRDNLEDVDIVQLINGHTLKARQTIKDLAEAYHGEKRKDLFEAISVNTDLQDKQVRINNTSIDQLNLLLRGLFEDAIVNLFQSNGRVSEPFINICLNSTDGRTVLMVENNGKPLDTNMAPVPGAASYKLIQKNALLTPAAEQDRQKIDKRWMLHKDGTGLASIFQIAGLLGVRVGIYSKEGGGRTKITVLNQDDTPVTSIASRKTEIKGYDIGYRVVIVFPNDKTSVYRDGSEANPRPIPDPIPDLSPERKPVSRANSLPAITLIAAGAAFKAPWLMAIGIAGLILASLLYVSRTKGVQPDKTSQVEGAAGPEDRGEDLHVTLPTGVRLNLSEARPINSGAFARIYKVQDSDSGASYAVRVYNIDRRNRVRDWPIEIERLIDYKSYFNERFGELVEESIVPGFYARGSCCVDHVDDRISKPREGYEEYSEKYSYVVVDYIDGESLEDIDERINDVLEEQLPGVHLAGISERLYMEAFKSKLELALSSARLIQRCHEAGVLVKDFKLKDTLRRPDGSLSFTDQELMVPLGHDWMDNNDPEIPLFTARSVSPYYAEVGGLRNLNECRNLFDEKWDVYSFGANLLRNLAIFEQHRALASREAELSPTSLLGWPPHKSRYAPVYRRFTDSVVNGDIPLSPIRIKTEQFRQALLKYYRIVGKCVAERGDRYEDMTPAINGLQDCIAMIDEELGDGPEGATSAQPDNSNQVKAIVGHTEGLVPYIDRLEDALSKDDCKYAFEVIVEAMIAITQEDEINLSTVNFTPFIANLRRFIEATYPEGRGRGYAQLNYLTESWDIGDLRYRVEKVFLELISSFCGTEDIDGLSVHTARKHGNIVGWIRRIKGEFHGKPNLLILDSHLDNTCPDVPSAFWVEVVKNYFGRIYHYVSPVAQEDSSQDYEALKESESYARAGITIITEPEELKMIEGPTLMTVDMDFFECTFHNYRSEKTHVAMGNDEARSLLEAIYSNIKEGPADIIGLDLALSGEPYLDFNKAFLFYLMTRHRLLDRSNQVRTTRSVEPTLTMCATKAPEGEEPAEGTDGEAYYAGGLPAEESTNDVLAHDPNKIVVVGASAMGYWALQEFVKDLPQNHPPIVVVQHVPMDSQQEFMDFARRSPRNIIMHELFPLQGARDYPLEDNMILVGRYINIDRDGQGKAFATVYDSRLTLLEHYKLEEDAGSIDRFFISAAEHFEQDAVCVVLSGTGSDGLKGANWVHAKKGKVLAQKVVDNVRYRNEMPGAVIGSDIPCKPVLLIDMAGEVMNACRPEVEKAGQDVLAPGAHGGMGLPYILEEIKSLDGLEDKRRIIRHFEGDMDDEVFMPDEAAQGLAELAFSEGDNRLSLFAMNVAEACAWIAYELDNYGVFERFVEVVSSRGGTVETNSVPSDNIYIRVPTEGINEVSIDGIVNLHRVHRPATAMIRDSYGEIHTASVDRLIIRIANMSDEIARQHMIAPLAVECDKISGLNREYLKKGDPFKVTAIGGYSERTLRAAASIFADILLMSGDYELDEREKEIESRVNEVIAFIEAEDREASPPAADEKPPVSEEDMQRMAREDAALTYELLIDILHKKIPNGARHYEVRYDRSRLTDSQVGIIQEYIETLQDMAGEDTIRDMGFRGSSGTRPLISVVCKMGRSDVFGEGHIDVEFDQGGQASNYFLRIVAMLNMAFALACLPVVIEGPSAHEQNLIGFVQRQYRAVTGRDITLREMVELLSTTDREKRRHIILRGLRRIEELDMELRKYDEMALELFRAV